MKRVEIELLTKGYRLTTAEILYHMPDYPKLLQSYIWQELDISPDFPVLMKFLNFWEHELDGKLHSITVAKSRIIKPSELTFAKGEYFIH